MTLAKSARSFTIVVVVVGIVGAGILIARAQSKSTGLRADEIRAVQARARSEGGLQAAAAITGRYVGVAGAPNVGGPVDLDELVDVSRVIVVGTAVRNRMTLTTDGASIFTCYNVTVERSLKGGLRGPRLAVVAFRYGAECLPRQDNPARHHRRSFTRGLGPPRRLVVEAIVKNEPTGQALSEISSSRKDEAWG